MTTVQVKYAGSDITDRVIFGTARFESAVNGVGGMAHLRVRDLDRSLTPVPGALLELIVDGEPVWTGFAMTPKRVYVFPAINVTDFGLARFFDLEAVDLNVLFARRIVFNQSTPENVLAPLYGAHTADTTAITDLLADWLDLSGDGLDTSSGVENVGDINEDQAARAWEGSDTWGQAMLSISLLPAAIFYLRPNKVLAYVDDDTPDAPFGLSDAPNHSTTKGYREMNILLDGTSLANDVLCWGFGYGSNAPVFDRIENSTSIGTHGRWQMGQTTFGVYKQATINRIADSIINGSPEHRRGAKDDRTAVTLVTYEPGLLPAQKVPFTSTVFGWSDVLPIRKMEVTFDSPDAPRYELTLSHEIDTPWSFFDPWRFKFPGFGFKLPPFPVIQIPAVPGGCDCSITDTFDRIVAVGWGDSTAGPAWTFTYGPLSGSVDGSVAIATSSTDGTGFTTESQPDLLSSSIPRDVSMSIQFMFVDSINLYFDLNVYDGSTTQSIAGYNRDSGGFWYLAWEGDTAPTSGTPFTPTLGVWYNAKLELELNVEVRTKLWAVGDVEPGWTTKATSGQVWDPVSPRLSVSVFNNRGHSTSSTMQFDNLDITDVNRCTENRFDNFDRTVSGGWGTSTTGYPWITGSVLNGAIPSVTGTYGRTLVPISTAGSINDQHILGSGVWGSTFTMTALFRTNTTGINWRDTSFSIEGAAGALVRVRLDNDSGGVSIRDAGATDFQSYSGWSANTWMYVKWEHIPGTSSSMKVWNVGSTEPGWIATVTGSDTSFTPTVFRVVTRGRVGTSTAQFVADIDYIDFDYTDKPCYDNCTDVVLDDFEGRTVSGGWGTASSGLVWTRGGGSNGDSSVSSGFGILQNGASTTSESEQIVTGVSGDFNCLIKCAVSSDTDVVTAGFIFASLNFGWEKHSPSNRIFVNDNNGHRTTFPISNTFWGSLSGQAYFRARRIGSNAYLTLWDETTDEPSPQITSTADSGFYSSEECNFACFGTGTVGTQSLFVDSITFEECDGVGPAVGTPAGPLYGPFRENAVRIDATHYQLSRAILYGSTNVYFDGYIVRWISDYTIDAPNGILIFTDPVDIAVTVTCRYDAAGPL